MDRIPARHRKTARNAMVASAGLGPLGAFITAADIASIAAIWGACLVQVASDEYRDLDKETAIDICKTALLGMGGYYAGCKAATKAFLLIPFAGIFIGMGISSVANVIFTYRFVLTLCTIFQNEGGKLDLDSLGENIKAMFRGNGLLADAKDIVDIWGDW